MELYNKIEIGETYIIAEMSANHAGSIDIAKEIIWAAKESGADCLKIQTYTADTLTLNCDNEFFTIKSGLWKGETFYQLYGRAYTPWEWQAELKEEVEKAGMDFLSTPFDNTAVDFLENLGVEFYKLASFELIDIPLIRYVASKRKPIIMSTGMGTLAELDEAVSTIRNEGNDNIVLMRCASAYPAITDEMNLATMKNMSDTFGVPVGLSDHSAGAIGAVTAVAMGAKVIEKHFCLSRKINSADSAFSMEPCEFAEMVRDIRQVEKAIGTVKYGPSQQEMGSLIKRRSIFSSADIKAGDRITEDNIRVVRPGQGLHPRYYDELIGRVALCDIEKGTPIKFEMIGKIFEEA